MNRVSVGCRSTSYSLKYVFLESPNDRRKRRQKYVEMYVWKFLIFDDNCKPRDLNTGNMKKTTHYRHKRKTNYISQNQWENLKSSQKNKQIKPKCRGAKIRITADFCQEKKKKGASKETMEQRLSSADKIKANLEFYAQWIYLSKDTDKRMKR